MAGVIITNEELPFLLELAVSTNEDDLKLLFGILTNIDDSDLETLLNLEKIKKHYTENIPEYAQKVFYERMLQARILNL